MLADPIAILLLIGLSMRDTLLTVNGLLVDMKQTEYEEKGQIRSRFLETHKTWCNAIHYYQATTRKFDIAICNYLWARDELNNVLFWLYATLLFGFSFMYFLWRIMTHKRGWLAAPQGKTWHKNRRKWMGRLPRDQKF